MGRMLVDLDGEYDNEPIPVVLNRREWQLPPQLPAAVLDPLFEGRVDDLIALIIDIMEAVDPKDGGSKDDVDFAKIIGFLRRNPRVISGTFGALRAAFAGLLGKDQWQEWLDAEPTVDHYLKLGAFAFKTYGVSLGEALGLRSTSAGGGTTSKPTSSGTTASTPGGFGSLLATRT